MTRVLILTQYYHPEGPIPTSLAEGLAARGYAVEVLTAFPHYLEGRIYGGYRQRLWLREEINGIPVLRVPLYPSHDDSSIRRCLTYGTFAFSASALGRVLARRPDVIYVYCPPITAGLAAQAMRAFRSRVPIILHVQDLWPEGIGVRRMASRLGLLPVIRSLARHVYRRADRVLAISPGFKRTIEAYGVSDERVEVLYNWCDSEAIVSPPGVERRVGPDSEAVPGLSIVYAGNLGPVQHLDTVLDAAALLRDSAPSIRFTLVGDGIDRDRLVSRKLAERLDNVTFLPRTSFEEVARILAAADASLVHLAPDPMCRMWIPSKVQALLCLGSPMLLGVDGDAEDLLRDAGAGMHFRPGDARSLVGAITKLQSMPSASRYAMGANGRRYYLQHLAFSRACDRVAECIDLLSASRVPASDRGFPSC